MINYIIRRILYAIPILVGVNLLTFALFFVVNTPDNMARIHLGVKHVTPEAIAKWKHERGYDKPLMWNSSAQGVKQASDTIFFEKSVGMFAFDFGRSDEGRRQRQLHGHLRRHFTPPISMVAAACATSNVRLASIPK